jgi:hypothetical protein
MARIRTIKPSFWEDELVGALTPVERLVFLGCFSLADDEGRLRGSAAWVRNQLFAYDDAVTREDVELALQRLHALERIVLYGSAQRYVHVPNFAKHQKINRRSESQLPPPSKTNPTHKIEPGVMQGIHDQLTEPSRSPHGALTDGMEWNGMEGKGREEEKPSLSTSAKPKPTWSREANLVFEHWRTQMGKRSNTIFSGDRKTKVLARLREGYTVDQLKQAIDGYSQSSFHRGENPRGVAYDDLELICRSGAKVEQGIELATRRTTPTTPGTTRHSVSREYDDGIQWHNNDDDDGEDSGGEHAAA